MEIYLYQELPNDLIKMATTYDATKNPVKWM